MDVLLVAAPRMLLFHILSPQMDVSSRPIMASNFTGYQMFRRKK